MTVGAGAFDFDSARITVGDGVLHGPFQGIASVAGARNRRRILMEINMIRDWNLGVRILVKNRWAKMDFVLIVHSLVNEGLLLRSMHSAPFCLREV